MACGLLIIGLLIRFVALLLLLLCNLALLLREALRLMLLLFLLRAARLDAGRRAALGAEVSVRGDLLVTGGAVCRIDRQGRIHTSLFHKAYRVANGREPSRRDEGPETEATA